MPPSATAAASATTPACIVVGMAGSGKTTLLHRLSAYSQEQGRPSYFINLDPAALHVPYPANVDIRDTIKYKEVMKECAAAQRPGVGPLAANAHRRFTGSSCLAPGTNWAPTAAS